MVFLGGGGYGGAGGRQCSSETLATSEPDEKRVWSPAPPYIQINTPKRQFSVKILYLSIPFYIIKSPLVAERDMHLSFDSESAIQYVNIVI